MHQGALDAICPDILSALARCRLVGPEAIVYSLDTGLAMGARTEPNRGRRVMAELRAHNRALAPKDAAERGFRLRAWRQLTGKTGGRKVPWEWGMVCETGLCAVEDRAPVTDFVRIGEP